MKEKITKLMKSEGLTTSRLAELLEIQPSAVSHLVSGRNNPRYDLIIRILRRFPRINPDWLLLDNEDMYRDIDGDDDATKPVEMSLFDDDELLAENNASTEALKKVAQIATRRDGAKQIRATLQGNSEMSQGQDGNLAKSPTTATAAQPVRLMVLYDDGSFESFSLR